MDPIPTDSDISRRQFLIRTAKAGAAAAAVGTGAWLTHIPSGAPIFEADADAGDHFEFSDYSIPELGSKLCIASGADRSETIRIAFKALGGVERFIKKGDRVLLKVNAAFASPPSVSATTHPQMVADTAALCYQAGASKVIVTDNPINDPSSCFMLSGIGQAARTSGADLVMPSADLFKPVTVKNASLIRQWSVLAGPFKEVNKVIGIAPVKDHHRSGASMSMKNWYGLLGGRRNIFHQDIHTIIKELAMMIQPTLVILDGMTTMMRNGPTGGSISDLKQTNTIIVSTDQVAADAFAATLLDKSADEFPYIKMAQEAGAGTADYLSIHPIRVNS